MYAASPADASTELTIRVPCHIVAETLWPQGSRVIERLSYRAAEFADFSHDLCIGVLLGLDVQSRRVATIV